MSALRCCGCDRVLNVRTVAGLADARRQGQTLAEWTYCHGCGKNVCCACGSFSGPHTSWRDHRSFAEWIGYAPRPRTLNRAALRVWATEHGAGVPAHPFLAEP